MKTPFLADFHVHSNFSDGRLSIPELVDFYGERGFGAIAITDHIAEDTTLAGKAAKWLGQVLTEPVFPLYRDILRSEAKRAWDTYSMVLIPGIELSKNYVSNRRSAHLIALGIEEFHPADGDIVQLTDWIHVRGGLAIAAHPVFSRKLEKQTYYLWDRRDELRNLFDAWEVASGPYLFSEVLESGLPMLANSDLHRPSQIHSWKTLFYCERSWEAIRFAILNQNIDFVFYDGKPTISTTLKEYQGHATRAANSLRKTPLAAFDTP